MVHIVPVRNLVYHIMTWEKILDPLLCGNVIVRIIVNNYLIFDHLPNQIIALFASDICQNVPEDVAVAEQFLLWDISFS